MYSMAKLFMFAYDIYTYLFEIRSSTFALSKCINTLTSLDVNRRFVFFKRSQQHA